MFKMKLSNGELLKEPVAIISDIIDEGVFKIDKNGLSLLAPDRTMVSVVDFRLLSSAFEEFKVEGEASIGLNLASLTAVLKRLKANDRLLIEGGKDNRLKLTIQGKSKRVFELPILDISAEKPPVDQLSFTTSIEIDPSLVEEGISDADIIGDSVIFEASAEAFRMHAKGDVSSSQLEISKGENGLASIKAEGPVKAQYPLEYLKKMIKAGKLAKNMSIEFGADYPMRLGFKSVTKLSLHFILAWRFHD